MGTSGRLGDDGVDNPEIRDGGIDNPDIREGGVDNPEIRDGGIDNPDIRVGVDDPSIRDASVDNPDIRVGVDNPDLVPDQQPMSGGLPVVPIAVGIGVIVLAVAAFSLLGGGGAPAASMAATAGSGTTAQPGDTSAPGTTGANGGPATTETANLELTGTDVSGRWQLDGGADVSPTTEIIAAVWTETVDDVAAGHGDLIVLSMGGPVFEGTQPTSTSGITLSISISRIDAQGNDVFDHLFASSAGECQVTMQRTSTGVSGSFSCTSISDADGHTSGASGSFAT